METSSIKTSENLKSTTLSSIQIQLLKSWTLLLWKLSSMETSEKLKSRRLSDIQNQLFKSWTLSFHDNITGHMLVSLQNRMKHWSCVIGGQMHSCASMWDPFCSTKKHLGFLLRQYSWPLATWLGAEQKRKSCANKKCQLADFWRKRKQCGMTSLQCCHGLVKFGSGLVLVVLAMFSSND